MGKQEWSELEEMRVEWPVPVRMEKMGCLSASAVTKLVLGEVTMVMILSLTKERRHVVVAAAATSGRIVAGMAVECMKHRQLGWRVPLGG